jgi:putative redox protein
MALIASTQVGSKDGYAQQIESGGHRLAADEPESNGGTNSGPAPYGLLLGALGACTSITLRMYARRKSWELGEIQVQLRLHKSAEGGDRIEREIRFGATLTEEQRARLTEIAEKTPVTKTIKAGAVIETRVV